MRAGFTLTEVLITIALLGVLVAITLPVGISFYQRETLEDTALNVGSTLRRARLQAIAEKRDAAFGVKILSTSFVLFEGGSWAGRTVTEDESFNFPTGVSAAGLDEVVFVKLSGEPNMTGTITLSLGGAGRTITVNPRGVIY